MKLLLDTHILCWTAVEPARLSRRAKLLLNDLANTLIFSVASIWEITIKRMLGKRDFPVDPLPLRAGLLANGYEELLITSEHVAEVANMPSLHRDPFDRLLLAQAIREGAAFVTADAKVGQYSGPIIKI